MVKTCSFYGTEGNVLCGYNFFFIKILLTDHTMIGKLEKQNKHLSSTQNYISYLSFSVSIFSVNYWINSVFLGGRGP